MEAKTRPLVLGGLLKRIGNFEPSRFVRDFDQRLMTQKTVYLLQAFGLYLGYPFNWYLRGPYSPKLTRDLYGLTESYDHIPEVRFVDKGAEGRFAEFIELLTRVGGNILLLELLSSVHFMQHLQPNLREKQLFLKVQAEKPKLSTEKFKVVLGLLKRYSLLEGNHI